MATNISWCKNPDGTPGEVWNPTVGCTHSGRPGCDNCYAKSLHDKRHKAFIEGKLQQLPQYAKPFNEVQLLPDRLDMPLKWKKPRTIFVDSMTDLFHEDVPDDFIDMVMAIIALCPRHQFILLTKRADRMLDYYTNLVGRVHRWDNGEAGTEEFLITTALDSCDGYLTIEFACSDWLDFYNARNMGWPLPNLHLGVSCSTQKDVDEMVRVLLQTPAAHRMVSLEPLVEEVDVPDLSWEPDEQIWVHGGGSYTTETRGPSLDFVIAGGESGPNARPMELDWVRKVRDDCAAASDRQHANVMGYQCQDRRCWECHTEERR
jgi:protein gp37